MYGSKSYAVLRNVSAYWYLVSFMSSVASSRDCLAQLIFWNSLILEIKILERLLMMMRCLLASYSRFGFARRLICWRSESSRTRSAEALGCLSCSICSTFLKINKNFCKKYFELWTLNRSKCCCTMFLRVVLLLIWRS